MQAETSARRRTASHRGLEGSSQKSSESKKFGSERSEERKASDFQRAYQRLADKLILKGIQKGEDNPPLIVTDRALQNYVNRELRQDSSPDPKAYKVSDSCMDYNGERPDSSCLESRSVA